MTRREFAAGSIGLTAATLLPLQAGTQISATYAIYVAPDGDDSNPGTLLKPVSTLSRAQKLARDAGRSGGGFDTINVFIRGGVYYLTEPLIFKAEDSSESAVPIIYRAFESERPILRGSIKLNLKWTPYRDGIFMAKAPAGLTTDQLFVDGKRQILARYPNYDPTAKYFDGFAADAFSRERAARWADPVGGFIHAMHPALWGDFHYRITGKDANGDVTYEGGWQNNRPSPMHKSIRFVESIFEELDSPGEWFLNAKTDTIYFYPPADVDLDHALVEAVQLRSLIEFHGDEQKPVRNIQFEGLTLQHTARTFMETREPILRTDWAIYRGGAVFLKGSEDCGFVNCDFEMLGGNAVFASGYNRRLTIHGCQITEAGGNGICFVGEPKAVRSPLFNYSQRNALADIDLTPGPQAVNYPADCIVDNCLIHRTGRFEKQTAPIEIDMAQSITISSCSIYDVPRAGINIGDGCWGGHIVEYCDVFDTVKETGDHGSFNSWGRDRYWLPNVKEFSENVRQYSALPFLDVVQPITLHHNRWRCDHGWDIDLDDGSSHYKITDNLCLNGGIKNREGYGRIVKNNITVNNSFHLHVWPEASGDVYESNIVFGPYRPIGMPEKPWGKDFDDNFVHAPGTTTAPATALQEQSGRDPHSLNGDAQFSDPTVGDFTVRSGSPALSLGFQNFRMDDFGVQIPRLRLVARQPEFGARVDDMEDVHRDDKRVEWCGATVRNIRDRGEMSAHGLPGVIGVVVVSIAPGSLAEKARLHVNDVILVLDGTNVISSDDLSAPTRQLRSDQSYKITVSRLQKEIVLASP